MPIAVKCKECGKRLKVKDAAAGKKAKCPQCGGVIRIPTPKPKVEEPPDDDDNPFGDLDLGELARLEQRGRTIGEGDVRECPDCGEMVSKSAVECEHCGYRLKKKKKKRPKPPPEPVAETTSSSDYDDDEGGFGGIIVFILIFVVGNAILYMTTGYVIIPIRR